VRAVGAKEANPGDMVNLSLRPEDVTLHLARPEGTAHENLIEGQVIDTIYLGSFLEGRVQVGPHEIGIQIDHFENLTSGQTVYLSFQPEYGLCLAN
jgi:ABC-type Fe3+/spermidine/putrescine transport system ATPase subunit